MKAISLWQPELCQRFKVSENGCWIWSGALSSEGYGILNIDGERKYAHRMTYQLFVGPIHHWQELDHLCRDRRCCNPAHLEAVSSYENSKRGNHPLFTVHRKQQCRKGHDLTNPENRHQRNDGRYRCKICSAEYQRKRREKIRNACD